MLGARRKMRTSRVSVVPMAIMVSARPWVVYSRLNHVKLGGCTSAAVAPKTSQRGKRFAACVANCPRRFSRES